MAGSAIMKRPSPLRDHAATRKRGPQRSLPIDHRAQHKQRPAGFALLLLFFSWSGIRIAMGPFAFLVFPAALLLLLPGSATDVQTCEELIAPELLLPACAIDGLVDEVTLAETPRMACEVLCGHRCDSPGLVGRNSASGCTMPSERAGRSSLRARWSNSGPPCRHAITPVPHALP